MEPQNQVQDTQPTEPLQHSLPPQPQQFVTNSSLQEPKKSKLAVTLTVLLVLALLGGGGLGYLYQTTSKDLDDTKAQLATASANFRALEAKNKSAKYNGLAYSSLVTNAQRECFGKGQTVLLFNQVVTGAKKADGGEKLIAVGQYICMNGNDTVAGPVRFIAVQSYDDGKVWEMTYGSSTVEPYHLPNYIYETDPALFNRTYNNPSHR